MIYDFCIIGGGIVGLATAMELLRKKPGCSLVLLEKCDEVATHQTGHNSGVIHAGVYYPPGSLKADFCRRGAEATKAFASEHGIPFEVCGKLIVATSDAEVGRMNALFERARQNTLEIRQVSKGELREIEPNITGVGALLVPSTGIIDYKKVSRKIAEVVTRGGGEIRLGTAVAAIRETPGHVEVDTAGGSIQARKLVACAGLQSDRLAAMSGLKINHRIVPFRGEYYALDERLNQVVNHLIYPVPDPDMPFLGIHLTRMIDGRTTVGPNATLGAAREGYARRSFNLKDVASMASFPGFWKTIAGNWRYAASEIANSTMKSVYLKQCHKYCPTIELSDLKLYPAGIRAQAVMNDGSLVHDFLFLNTSRMLHVCNAPSPAATSAMPIAEKIAAMVLEGA
jgi:(S)-2-hydroxyglutarate dehydrogenase